jgi:putative SOS response-associated peptidase YedK
VCGRFTLIRLAEFTDLFPWIRGSDELAQPRYNIAPSQQVAAVLNEPDPRIDHLKWGLVPSWAKDPAIGNRLINARAETLSEKPSFRNAVRRRRCVIPADGFFEWKTESDGKTRTPHYVTVDNGRPFALAGLWETWRDPAGVQLRTCTIITTAPNALMRRIHNRMPVILDEEAMRRWLVPGEHDPVRLQELLVPYPSERMSARVVSRRVNNPRYDAPDVLEME